MFVSNLKKLIQSVTGLLSTHVVLLQLDLQEAKERLSQLALLLIGLTVVSGVSLIGLTVLIGMVFWQYSPFYTVLGLTVFYAGCVLFLLYRFGTLVSKFALFSTTHSEWIKTKKVLFDEDESTSDV